MGDANRLMDIMPATPAGVPRVSPSERIYAIGDIHGRCDLLLRLLERIEEDSARFDDGRTLRLVFLGDYIDRGDHSREVLEVLSDLSTPELPDFGFLLGNHEAALLSFLGNPASGPRWFRVGGRQTLASYGVRAPRDEDPETLARVRNDLAAALGRHRDFLTSLSLTEQSGDVLFTHAGVNPACADPRADPDAILWGCADFGGETPVPGRRIVHGHFDAVAPVSHPGRICVDTGAYYSGRLTAVRLDETEEFLTVTI
jgi:serine/threonine protein phosphatase 1